MEVTTLPIGPLKCDCCGKITYHQIVFKTRWYVPALWDRLILKSSLKCNYCEKQYKMNDIGKNQAKLYVKNFGKDRHGISAFEQLLINAIKQNNVVINGIINGQNLEKAVQFMFKKYGSGQEFDEDFYRRYIILLSTTLIHKSGLEDKYFK